MSRALTVFSSSDAAIASVNANGLVDFNQTGEAAILCRYLDSMQSVRLTYLQPRPGLPLAHPPENNYVDRHVFAKLKLLEHPAFGAVYRPGIPAPRLPRPVRHLADAGRGQGFPRRAQPEQAGRPDRSPPGQAGVRRLLDLQMARPAAQQPVDSADHGRPRVPAVAAEPCRPQHALEPGCPRNPRPPAAAPSPTLPPTTTAALTPTAPARSAIPRAWPKPPLSCSSAFACSAPSAITIRSSAGPRTTITTWRRGLPG